MTTEFKLPDVGEGLEEAEIVEWLVEVGDTINRDQPLVEILTDKSQTQLPSPVAGVISRLGFEIGDMAHVGQILVVIDDGDGLQSEAAARDEEPADEPAPSEPEPPRASAVETSTPVSPVVAGRRPKASPVVRRKALEAGIDLTTVTGTGPGGRILETDLVSPAPPSAPATRFGTTPVKIAAELGQMPYGRQPLRGIRRVTAEAMERSWQIPHVHGNDELDATALMAGRARIRELHPDSAANLTPVAFFVMAVANALRRYPMVNASIDVAGGEIVVHDHVNIGLAVASNAGLMVPVIMDADKLDLFEIAESVSRLGAAVRERTISATEMRGGTCTITNYGSLGGRFATPIIRSPEVAIVGFGSIKQRPFVVNGDVVARPTLPVATAADHRLIDGDLMTAFQEHVMALLTDPVSLLVR